MELERIQTYCAMCMSRCGVVATVEEGRFSKVSVDRKHPNGCICMKGAAAPEMVYSPDRLQHPMVRTRPKDDPDPGWRKISWDEALSLIASRLLAIRDRHGAEAVVFGRATPAANATVDFEPWVSRLANAFGTPNILTTTHICTWNRVWGAKHTYGFPTPAPDIDNARCILLWGVNPQATQPIMAKQLSRAKRRGAKLIVIDPRRHADANKADCWLRVRPGSDGALALAMIHVLLEEKLFDAAFARDWTNAPFLLRCDTGALVRSDDLPDCVSPGAFVVWDATRDRPVVWNREEGLSENDVEPGLFGTFTCKMADGSLVECRTVLDELSRMAAPFAPELSADVTWVEAEDVRRAVRMFMAHTPSAYTSWTGTELHGSAMQINRAIACFYALTGQFDKAGSNVLFIPTPIRPITGDDLLPPGQAERRLGLADHPLGPPNDPGNIQSRPLFDAIIEQRPYPVKAMMLFGSDVLLGHGDPVRGAQALKALEFYVHVDLFENQSARFADLLLPACSSWECEAVRPFFMGASEVWKWSQLRKAVIPPLHDSRPDQDIIFDLAERLGLNEHFFAGDMEAAWNYHLEPSGLTVEQLRSHPVGIGTKMPALYQKYAMPNPDTGRPRGFPTGTGRIEIYSTRFADAGYDPLPRFSEPFESPLDESSSEYPLVLTNYRTITYTNQQHRNIASLRLRAPSPEIEIHPETGAGLAIGNGDWAIVETRVGRIRLKVRYNAALHPRVVCAPYGWWQACKDLNLPGYDPLSPDGANVNLLISNDGVDPISASVPHRSRMCRLKRIDVR